MRFVASPEGDLVVDLRGRGGTPQVAFRVLRIMREFDGPVVALIDGTLSKTTGAQIPVDGGNDRVI